MNHRRALPAAVAGYLTGILLAVTGGWISADEKKAESKSGSQTLEVCNESGKAHLLLPKDWSGLPRHQVEVKDRDGRTARYEGVSLVEVLRFAGVTIDGHLRGPRVANYILIEAADGYRAVFALAEVDPSMTDRIVLVADRRDGNPLDSSAGPYRLVVPHDKLHSRWVRQLVKVSIQSAHQSR